MANAFNVTHQIRPGGSFESLSLANSCSTMTGDKFSLGCNPASFPYFQSEGISLSFLGKADGDSIDNGRDLIFDPITEDLIRKLFEEKSFNSFTFDGTIRFNTSLFELSYTPYFLIADLYIFNPAFPEISVNLLNRETLNLTSGDEIFRNRFGFKSISVGYNLYYFNNYYSNTSFSLFDLTQNQPEELIKFQDDSGFDGNFSILLKSEKSSWIPDFSFQVMNILDAAEFNIPSNPIRQRTLFLFERYSRIGLGKEFETDYGGLQVNFETFFLDFYEEFYLEQSSLGIRYNLNLFSLNFGMSKYYQNIGALFRSENMNVGINYSRERDAPTIQSTSDNSTYILIEVGL